MLTVPKYYVLDEGTKTLEDMYLYENKLENYRVSVKQKCMRLFIPFIRNEFKVEEFYSVYNFKKKYSRKVQWAILKMPDSQEYIDEIWVVGQHLYKKDISWNVFIESLVKINNLTSAKKIIYFAHPREKNIKLPSFIEIRNIQKCFENYVLSSSKIAKK